MGILSKPTLPTTIEGVHDFEREVFHTTRWPKDWSPSGKRVGIIGTGATAIQIIQEIVKSDLKSLTVFQRTPNWSAPLRNEPITTEEMQEIRCRYPEIFERCRESYSGFVHMPHMIKTLDVSEEERTAYWEKIYATRGFEKWQSNFSDIGTSREANALVSKFFADKVRERVNDPKTAEKLIPKCHGFGTRRVPLETHYFEAYNKPNVRLVDIKNESPITRITPKGVLLETGEEVELDTLIYATGFDAVTGPISAVDFRGVDGLKITDCWKNGPRTFLGFLSNGFPNMMMVMGPHQMFGNIPRSIEYAVNWIGTFIEYCAKNDITRVEAKQEKVDEWTQHVFDCAQGLLANEIDSWMTGVNTNVKGKQHRIIARYQGPGPGFRKRILDVAARNYEDMSMS
ncbi:hypothetical protein PRZ48_007815 [Zasmidium cellare]|uniref:Uncharacterized protein n=1 Tax=Zasmidium cellare TaxID=395010 RepID=A0ABR0EKT7_ZASCE|nr:hypothetical protein PRZ48_007815 [Zasmidium cellare]